MRRDQCEVRTTRKHNLSIAYLPFCSCFRFSILDLLSITVAEEESCDLFRAAAVVALCWRLY